MLGGLATSGGTVADDNPPAHPWPLTILDWWTDMAGDMSTCQYEDNLPTVSAVVNLPELLKSDRNMPTAVE